MKKRNLKKKDALLDTLASTKNLFWTAKNDISYSVRSAGQRNRELSSASYCIFLLADVRMHISPDRELQMSDILHT
jgi:hypothetical protein